MGNQHFFNILILCTIAGQGIWALLEENEKFSDTLVRKKRIISQYPQLERTLNISYIVHILKDWQSHCGASILSPTILLTAAFCVQDDNAIYVILSNSIHINSGLTHNIDKKYIRFDYNSTSMANNIALLVISPRIDLKHSYNRPISLNYRRGRLPLRGILSGWGCIHLAGIHTLYPKILQSASLPILNSERCQEIFGNFDRVSDVEICTHDPFEKKRSCYGDIGGPLVTGNTLLGVLSWIRVIPNKFTPDVYTNIGLNIYREWIIGIMKQHEE